MIEKLLEYFLMSQETSQDIVSSRKDTNQKRSNLNLKTIQMYLIIHTNYFDE